MIINFIIAISLSADKLDPARFFERATVAQMLIARVPVPQNTRAYAEHDAFSTTIVLPHSTFTFDRKSGALWWITEDIGMKGQSVDLIQLDSKIEQYFGIFGIERSKAVLATDEVKKKRGGDNNFIVEVSREYAVASLPGANSIRFGVSNYGAMDIYLDYPGLRDGAASRSQAWAAQHGGDARATQKDAITTLQKAVGPAFDWRLPDSSVRLAAARSLVSTPRN
jgi:hypothetical protein